MKEFEFRTIKLEEIEEAIQIEQICFPPHEACTPESMRERVKVASDLFLVAMDRENGRIAGFLNGVATDEADFRDEFFTDANLHDTDGKYVMLLGLDVLPEYRGRSLATKIVNQYKQMSKKDEKKCLVLTCLEEKVKMYQHMGFYDAGMANSTWGDEVWHEMRYDVSADFVV